MRRVFLCAMLILLLAGACSPTASTAEAPVVEEPPTSSPAPEEATEEPTEAPTQSPTEEPTETPTDEPTEEAAPVGEVEEMVIKQLAANLRLDESDIAVVRSEATEFADACLDVSMEGVLCAQVLTAGHIVVLEANGVEYEYHTNEDASRIQPATLALIWKREGGIAGFCDTLTVFRSGEVYTSQCSAATEGAMGTLADLLSADELAEFHDWMDSYGHMELDQSDPEGVADRMVITLEMFGDGKERLTSTEEEDLLNFSQDLYQELAY